MDGYQPVKISLGVVIADGDQIDTYCGQGYGVTETLLGGMTSDMEHEGGEHELGEHGT